MYCDQSRNTNTTVNNVRVSVITQRDGNCIYFHRVGRLLKCERRCAAVPFKYLNVCPSGVGPVQEVSKRRRDYPQVPVGVEREARYPVQPDFLYVQLFDVEAVFQRVPRYYFPGQAQI